VSPYRWKTPGLLARLVHRVGYRGFILLTLAVVDFAYGRTFVWTDDPGARITNSYLVNAIPIADHVAGQWLWLTAWWGTGLFCLVNAFRRNDHWGYGMAVALKILYVGAIVLAGERGMPNATTRLIVWTWIAVMVFVEARRGEPGRDIGAVARDLDTGGIPRVTNGD
jgi:hypothetical protein